MDHRGPEHHYDELDSPENGRTFFFQQGEVQPETVEGEGQDRPYRGQPNPVEEEMKERNTFEDGRDQGGNPLAEGILAKSIKEEAEEEAAQVTDPTEPAGLGELHPVKDNQWKPGDKTDRGMGRDEMLGSVRKAMDEFGGEDSDWEKVVNDFEAVGEPSTVAGKQQKEVKELESIPTATWLEGTKHDSSAPDFPIEHLGWDIVDVVEPSKEFTEASNKYSMPLPKGITDNLHEALIKTNAWVENPEENGKLRPYKDYWSVIRPKVTSGSIQIGVENPHMADIINDVARTDTLSAFSKIAAPLALAPIAEMAGGALAGEALSGLAGGVMKNALGGMVGDAIGGLFGGGGGGEQAAAAAPVQGESYFGSVDHRLADTYRVPNPLGDDPVQRIPISPAEKQLGEAIDAALPPSGYKAYPSGHGEPVGRRDPSGRILPREQQQPAGDQPWNDPNLPNPEPEYEEALKENPNAFGVPENEQNQPPQNPQGQQQQQASPSSFAGKAMGFIPEIGKALLNSPNKDLQTRGAPGTVRGVPYYGNYGDEYEHPSSVTRRVEDPVNGGIDPHQRSDGSNDDWGYDMLDVNEIGSTNDPRGKDDAKERIKRQFASSEDWEDVKKDWDQDESTGSEALDKFFGFLPLIMEFLDSEESGLNDPIVKSVHEGLESEFPGYLDSAIPEEDNHIIMLFRQNQNEGKKESAAFSQGTGFSPQPANPTPTPAASAPSQNVNGKCPKCNNTMGPDMICQQCSPDSSRAFAPSVRPSITQDPQLNTTGSRVASDHQGPHTDEQQSAVAELLIQQGREDEIPLMIANPYQYDKELSEVQNQNPMLGEDPEDAAQPPMEQPAPNQGMPPGVPPMGAPTPGDLNPAGPGAMQPPVMASVFGSMLNAAFKYGADNVAGTCPKCDSHTTKMVQQDGLSRCHTCNHEWQDDTFQKSDGDSSNSSTTSSFYQSLNIDELGSPEPTSHIDSFSEPEVEEFEIDDSSHTWTDESGKPLQEGKEYEIYANDYDIPDVGRVNEVKPDSITYTIESDGGLQTTIEIDRKEADLNGYRFSPSNAEPKENPPGIEENMDSKPVPVPGENTDLSTPHIQIGSSVKESDYRDDPAYPGDEYFDSMEDQSGLIDAGKSWLLDLDGPFLFREFEGLDWEDYAAEIESLSPEQIENAINAHWDGGWENFKEMYYDQMLGNYETQREANTKIAGKHYTPMEQRELIDEYGEARNADKLNLEGTHYAEAEDDYFLFGC